MSWVVTNLISAILLPPLNLLVLCAIAVMLWHKRPVIARWLASVSLVLLWLLCTPFVASGLLRLLEGAPATPDIKAQSADAIVVLGGGMYLNAPEYGTDTVGANTLVRLRYAARLQRQTGAPVLVAGGSPMGIESPEALQMKATLERDFIVPVKWTESESRDTMENARFSYRILNPVGVKRIYLVTQAWHMPRAARAFRSAGFEVIPAPTAYTTSGEGSIVDYLPNGQGLRDSHYFMHEVIGLLWYRARS